jgi:dephospho-CoA kinase
MNVLKKKYITKDRDSRLHHCPIPVIGLTGGIATGKTTASKILEGFGFRIISADQLIKEIYKTTDTIEFIKKEFPEVISFEEIDFRKLRELAFSKKENREILEKHLYAKLPEQFTNSYSNEDKVIIYDVPLLFEKELEKLIDHSLLIYAPRAVQIDRLIKRDKIDEKLANEILENQLDIEKKKELADYTIENTSNVQALEGTLNVWLSTLFE